MPGQPPAHLTSEVLTRKPRNRRERRAALSLRRRNQSIPTGDLDRLARDMVALSSQMRADPFTEALERFNARNKAMMDEAMEQFARAAASAADALIAMSRTTR